MASPMDLLESLQDLDIDQVASDSLKEHEETIAEMNASQLAQGRKSDGKYITPEYADLTIELKKKKSGLAAVTDVVTLFDTGSHYKNLYAEVKDKQIEYGSRDSKSEALQEKYGQNIYGPDDDSKDELVEGFLKPTFEQKIEEKTGLVFS